MLGSDESACCACAGRTIAVPARSVARSAGKLARVEEKKEKITSAPPIFEIAERANGLQLQARYARRTVPHHIGLEKATGILRNGFITSPLRKRRSFAHPVQGKDDRCRQVSWLADHRRCPPSQAGCSKP